MNHKKANHHSTMSRIKKLRKKRKKIKLIKNIAFLMIVIIAFIFIKRIYLINKCKDLNYATTYYFTNGDKDKTVLRVQEQKLIFCDTKSAVIQVTGLSKEKPHKKVTFNGHFKKSSNKSWEMTNCYILDTN